MHLQMSSFWKLKDGAMYEVSFYVPLRHNKSFYWLKLKMNHHKADTELLLILLKKCDSHMRPVIAVVEHDAWLPMKQINST